MHITAIKPVLADGGHRIFVFVKIETDQPGLIGWGEASLEGKPRAVAGCLEDMAPMIAGQDPTRVEHCWQILYRSGFWRLGVIGLSALSGITCHAGGISEVRRIAAMAEVYYAGLAPHNPYGPVSTAACVQVDLAAPNFVIQEMVDPDAAPQAMELVVDPLPVVDGHILPPDKPGIGVEVDEAACPRRPPDFERRAGGRVIREYGAYHADGGIADS